MTERIEIENFLTIEEASIDLRPICVLIGPQASGKSVIAKLLFFCREGVKSTLRSSVEQAHSYDEFKEALTRVFSSYFKSDYWSRKPFKIDYVFGSYEIKLRRTKKSNGHIDIILSSDIEELFSKTQAQFHNVRTHRHDDKERSAQDSFLFREFLLDIRRRDPFEELLRSQVFIPSSRSFFVLFKERMFSFLVGSADNYPNVDPFLRDFGPKYEQVKDLGILLFDDEMESPFYKKVVDFRREILRGDYVRERNREFIHDKSRGLKTRVEDASSGQQEALPMLAVLSEWPLLAPEGTRYFIEEPEAHLFPSSQRAVVELIAFIYRMRRQHFVITTHSPYILAALNNLILAAEVSRYTDVSKIVDRDIHVSFDDVVAYSVKNGRVKNINEEENRLIGSSVIDSVSDDFSKIFEKLILLLGEHQDGSQGLPGKNKK